MPLAKDFINDERDKPTNPSKISKDMKLPCTFEALECNFPTLILLK